MKIASHCLRSLLNAKKERKLTQHSGAEPMLTLLRKSVKLQICPVFHLHFTLILSSVRWIEAIKSNVITKVT